MKPVSVPSDWTRITDPELCWMAMIAARAGQPFMFGMTCWESGCLDLFDRHMRTVQKSLAGYVKGQRFVVVWRPLELDRPPEVYHAPRRRAGGT